MNVEVAFSYQYQTRDSHGGAVKATYAEIDGKPLNIYKDPKTGDGSKKSLKGLVAVNQDWTVKQEASWEEFRSQDRMSLVFKDGKLLRETTLDEIRERIKNEGLTKLEMEAYNPMYAKRTENGA